MALCCNKCYPICLPLPSCPAAVFLYTPPGDYGRGITVNIVKPGVNVQGQQLLSIGADGFVEIDLEGLPEGFFNPWGGQYTISYSDPDLPNQVLTFTAQDGQQYDSICLSFIQSISNQETVIAIINPINNDQPEL
jgi:hypothetical protein